MVDILNINKIEKVILKQLERKEPNDYLRKEILL